MDDGGFTRLEQLILDSHALTGRVVEFFGWRLAAAVGGAARVPRRDDWRQAQRNGVAVARWSDEAEAGSADAVVVHLQKGREATAEGLALAWRVLRPGGILVLAGVNELGVKTVIRRLSADLDQDPELLARGGRGRAAGFVRTGEVGPAMPRRTCFETAGVSFESRAGVFSSGGVDPGTALLLEHLGRVEPPRRLFDSGCGLGVLGLAAARRWPEARAVLADVDDRAVTAARSNAAANNLADHVECHWWDACAEPPPLAGRCDLALINPPFHAGGAAVDLAPGQAVIQAARQALAPGGRVLLVANRTLPWERELAALGRVEQWAQDRHYKVLAAFG